MENGIAIIDLANMLESVSMTVGAIALYVAERRAHNDTKAQLIQALKEAGRSGAGQGKQATIEAP